MGWLAVKAFGLPRGAWIVLAVLAALAGIAGLLLLGGARERSEAIRNQDIGASVQRETDLRELVERAGEARKVTDEIDRQILIGSGIELHAACLRSARTPENCQRFLPAAQAAER